MSDKKKQHDGVGFWKPLGVGLLAGASSLSTHGEPIEPKPIPLPALIAQPVTVSDWLVAYLPHGQEPATGYTNTFKGVVAMETTSSGMGSWQEIGSRRSRGYYYGQDSIWIVPIVP